MIDGHGDDLWRFGDKVRYNFSTNIHSAFDFSQLMKKLGDAVGAVSNYPEPEPVSVEKALADKLICDPCEVLVTNGATEAIYLIAQEFSFRKSAILVPTFREYQDACAIHNHSITFIHDLSEIPSACDTVWLCNPNNPTGKVIPKLSLIDILNKNHDKLFVIDQAYSDYTLCDVLSPHNAVMSGNVILLGSLTKRFAVPGLRIGYAVGNKDIIERLRRWRMPWSVNGLAIEAALFLLKNASDYQIDAAMLHSEALRISSVLSDMDIEVYPTDCNFILCRLPSGTSAELKQYLVDEYGILIRDASNFESLGERHFRVAAQGPGENDQLIKGIREWLTL